MPPGIYGGILAICWGGLGLVWVAGWLYNVWRAPAVQRRSAFLPGWVLVVALAWLVSIGLRHAALPFLMFTASWLQLVGATVLVAATAFTLWARWVLGTMWAAVAAIKEGHQLRTEGPYRITRHPIYTGLLGMLLGSMLLAGFGVWVPYFIGVLIAAIAKVTAEERLLLATFGEQYTQYQHRVPQLIPGTQGLTRRRHHEGS
jgi:protein-S-isoprenylcysteine O-methyltransferase Ste14